MPNNINEERLESLFEESQQLKKAGKLVEAIAKYLAALQLNPNYLPALNELVEVYEKQKEWDKALIYNQRVVELEPENSLAQARLARNYLQAKKLQKAIEKFKQAIALQKEQPAWVYHNYGDALKQNHQLDEAIAAWKKALESKPLAPHAVYRKIGNAWENLGRVNLALAADRQAVQLQIHKHYQKQKPSLEDAIASITARWPDAKSNNKTSPIFIFSAGWRSGSTLLQRLLMSSDDVVIWGEPYSHAGLIDSLSTPLKCINQQSPHQSWFSFKWKTPKDLADKFVANFYPDISYLIAAHIAYFEVFFEKPAMAKGTVRWGIKDVRLTSDHAIYLNWLFPQAKFIFLYRSPYDAYLSYRGARWLKKWPNEFIDTPAQFGLHWQELLAGYLAEAEKVDSMIFSYEELCSDEFDYEKLEKFLGISINLSILNDKKKGFKKQKNLQEETLAQEIKELKEVVESLASDLGYSY
ncbi:MAG: sulfotransferase [Gomphosphaeria aponina SAG 52.96 = DSM 107014]|uniref:Sulfotransferase n=1 Tax=Gomphosphaeria aponina SAG 52.96 = DSM 107014 TaxID=1521640 RepID=A0A941GSE2_9CHRO|nr:sulfotransferase [Gomphosphaeria aponina SAG 52.96 = DSM 107014]